MIKKLAIGLAALVVLAFLAIQAVPYGRDHTNPPVLSEPAWQGPRTRELAKRACFDCHSNETVWPWYSHIAPVSWLVQNDVQEGRAVLNFSEWGLPRESDDPLEPFIVVVGEGRMPPRNYRWLHPGAWLSASERDELVDGLQLTAGSTAQQGAEPGEPDE